MLSRYRQVRAFFLSLEDHARQAGGAAAWDRDGPRYRLENGEVRRAGHFRDGLSPLRRLAEEQFREPLAAVTDSLVPRP